MIIASLAISAVLCDVRPAYHAAAEVYPDAAPVYEYGYGVNSADGHYGNVNFNQHENRDGYQTYGEYKVDLPDGRTQIVSYKVDGDSGFIADVHYEGEAHYDAYKPAPYKPAPVAYKPAPKPVYKPAPVAYKPAPVVYKPAPVVAYKPAPVAYKPAPVVAYKPAPKPVYKPAPAPAREYGPVRFNPFG